MIVWGALASGFAKTLERIATGTDTGSIQIHQLNYLRSKSVYDQLPEDTLDTLQRSFSEHKASPRNYSSALVAFEKQSTYAQIKAVDPVLESQASDLLQNISKGSPLTSSSAHEVILGMHLAERLKVKVGSRIVLLGTGLDGSYANDVATVAGVFGTLNPNFDKNGLVMGIDFFRELFVMPDGFHEIAIFATTGDLQSLSEKMSKTFPESNVSTWENLRPILAKTIKFLGFAAWFTYSYAYIALCGLLLNVFLMNIYDRVREYGILRAIGFYNREIIWLIYLESLILTVFSCLIAVGVGTTVSYLLSIHGIDFTFIAERLSLSGLSLQPILYAHPTFWTVTGPTALVLLVVPCVAFYPAREAAKKDILEALTHV